MEIIKNSKDIYILRELAKHKMNIASQPVMKERRELWIQHKALQQQRPMIIIESNGVWDDFVGELKCEQPWARALEQELRTSIWHHENICDDTVMDSFISCKWDVDAGNFGVALNIEHGMDSEGRSLGIHWEPSLKNLDEDFEKLKPREYKLNKESTLQKKAFLEEVFADTIPIQIRGAFWWSLGMTQEAIQLVGLENFMMLMYDNPDGLHKLMAYLKDETINYAKWLECQGILSPNNENDYVGSGTYGFTDLLPNFNSQPDRRVKLNEMWGLIESQETVGVSPAMFEEFVIPHQREISKLFGLVYYGCCEPIHLRWDIIKKNIANLRSVSISPWCDQQYMAQALGNEYVFSRKPSPTLISMNSFDEASIYKDVEDTLAITKSNNCNCEIIMKDVHNINHDPSRLSRWVQLTRKAIEKVYGC